MSTIVYMWQVSACMGIFYGFYYFLLSRLTFFTINRWYLLTTLTVSFIIPLLTITVHEHAPIVVQQVMSINRSQVFTGSATTNIISDLPTQHVYNWLDLLKLIYLLTAVVLFVKLIATLITFFRNISRGSRNDIGGVSVISGNKTLKNGSFFNYIFLSDNDLSADDVQQIIEHEMLHVKLYHSVDRIIVKVAQIVLWFNPFVYGYARAIEENHEFEVDKEIGRSADKNRYADMLLHLSIANQGTLYNTFSKVPLKRRITMLFSKPTNHMKKTIYLLILPVVMISCLAFARFKNDVKKNVAGTPAFTKLKKAVQQNGSNILAIAKVKDDGQQNKYSAIKGIDLLKGKIKVLVDGKPYNADILYKISGSCIASSEINTVSAPGIGNDAVVKITTANGDITYMTAAEKNNLIKERSVPSTQFFTRLKLVDDNNNRFDKILIQFVNSTMTSILEPNDKAGFLIDDVFYTEDQVKAFNGNKIRSISSGGSFSPIEPGKYAKDVKRLFRFTTNKPANEVIDNGPEKGAQKAGQPADVKQSQDVNTNPEIKNERTTTAAEKRLIERTLKKPTSPFLNRFHIKRSGANDFDVIAVKFGNGEAYANLDVDEKVGIFIDGTFYSEDAMKKITVKKAKTLELDSFPMSHERKGLPNDATYAIPFSFVTKKI